MLPHNTSADPNRLVGQSYAANYLGVNERTVRRLITSGKLPAFRVGTKLVRVRHRDLEALLTRVPTVD
jgi:excisionase family DNA binding protein